MTRLWSAIAAIHLTTASAVSATPAGAADLSVISTMNVRPALDELRGTFEATAGHSIAFTSQGAAATLTLVQGGTGAGDVLVASRPMLEALASRGIVRHGSIADIAHSSLGVAVKAGTAALDVSTDAKFKDVLLEVSSIAYPDPSKGSLGGNYLSSLLVQWKMAERLSAKTQLVDGGEATGRFVAEGKAQVGINQIAEMRTVPGLRFLSPLPPALINKIVMSAGMLASARDPKAAAEWISFIASPAAATAFKANGMEQH